MDVLARMRDDRQKVSAELDEISRQKADLDTKERDVKTRLAELDNALRVAERYAAADAPETPANQTPAPLVLRSPDRLDVGDALWSVFEAATGGIKMADVIGGAEKRYGMTINPKTAGNYFWNWKNQGRARRDGYTWFPVRSQ